MLNVIRALLFAVLAFFRTRGQLAAEVLTLRYQLGALHRSVKRPRLTDMDRGAVDTPVTPRLIHTRRSGHQAIGIGQQRQRELAPSGVGRGLADCSTSAVGRRPEVLRCCSGHALGCVLAFGDGQCRTPRRRPHGVPQWLRASCGNGSELRASTSLSTPDGEHEDHVSLDREEDVGLGPLHQHSPYRHVELRRVLGAKGRGAPDLLQGFSQLLLEEVRGQRTVLHPPRLASLGFPECSWGEFELHR